jgi:hypothetical protein
VSTARSRVACAPSRTKRHSRPTSR